MRQSKAEVYLHLVWATLRREPFLTAEIERSVYRCIEKGAKRLKCEVLAIGGTADHVHLCVKLPTPLSIAHLTNQVKGVSSHFVPDQLPGDVLPFRWQEGYGVFSVGPQPSPPLFCPTSRDQKRHQAENSLHVRWDAETDEEYQPHS